MFEGSSHPETNSLGRLRVVDAKGCLSSPPALKISHTGLLLLEGQRVPVDLHAVTELHPELGLLLRGHDLPALLDVGEGRVGDSMVRSSAGLQGVHRGSRGSTDGRGAARDSARDGAKKHCAAGGRWQHHVEIGFN